MVSYDAATLTATVSLGATPSGSYRLFICGTTSITDLAGNKLDGGSDAILDFVVAELVAVPALGSLGLALMGLLLVVGALGVLRT